MHVVKQIILYCLNDFVCFIISSPIVMSLTIAGLRKFIYVRG